MGSLNRIVRNRRAILIVMMVASAFGSAADVLSVKGQPSGRSASARLAIRVMVVPITQTPRLAPRQNDKGAVAYHLEELRSSALRLETSEKTFVLDSNRVLETLTIVPE